MNEDMVRAAAKLLTDAWRDMTTIEAPPPALRPRNFEEAYAIQDEMAALIGQTTAGWKIGPASPGLMRAEGFDEPAAGRVFEPNIHRSPAELAHGRITNAKIECEFALKLSADVAPREQAYTAEGAGAAGRALSGTRGVRLPLRDPRGRGDHRLGSNQRYAEPARSARGQRARGRSRRGRRDTTVAGPEPPNDAGRSAHRRRLARRQLRGRLSQRPARRAGLARELPVTARDRPARGRSGGDRLGHPCAARSMRVPRQSPCFPTWESFA